MEVLASVYGRLIDLSEGDMATKAAETSPEQVSAYLIILRPKTAITTGIKSLKDTT